MSEKITFRELIESIAEETDNSKQFTHDFLKDFVDVINDGLEQDRKVSIAGFGKFKLRRMDEREGYNPQSGEKITIPEHNKIVFKPYKDLRELVNAPYAHLEPELIEEENTSSGEGNKNENVEQNKSESEDQKPVEQSNEDDFIPTAPPTSHQPEEETEKEITSESEEESPFDFDDDEHDEVGQEEESSSPYLSEDENTDEQNIDRDIVEFNGHTDNTTKEEGPEDDLSEFIGASDHPTEEKNADFEQEENLNEAIPEEPEEESVQATGGEEDLDPFAEGFEEEPEEKNKKSSSVPSSPSDKRSGKKVSAMPVIAAAVALLFVAAGAWYFTGSTSTNDTPEMVIDQPTSSAVAQKDNQESANQEAETSKTEKQNQSQETTTASSNASQGSNNNTELEIEEGQTLWSIAEEKYGNPRLWPWIYGKNGSLKDPDLILAGKSLSVPLPSGPQNMLNYSDSVGVAKGHIATYNWYKSNDSVKAKNHLWAAKSYHDNIRDISDIQIDKADLTYVNQSR